MRVWFISLLLSVSPNWTVGAQSELLLDDFLTPQEISKYDRDNSYKERMNLLRKVLDRQGKKITSLVKQRLLNESTALLREIQMAAELGIDENLRAAEQANRELRSKPVRKLEIKIRKLTETLNELKIAVPYESRVQFEETVGQLERFRDQLLNQLFEKSLLLQDVSERAEAGGPGHPRPAISLGLLPLSRNQARGGTEITGDQFTEEEYEKVQDAQELEKRVEVFLGIAEARLAEIERRMQKQEWDQEKPNPLEYFTYGQMMHAYWRALEGIMINIDEKTKYKLAEPKEIKKSLRALNKMIQQFIPRLEPVRQLSIDLKDEELYNEVRKGMRTSETAQRGSQMGLGAPVEN